MFAAFADKKQKTTPTLNFKIILTVQQKNNMPQLKFKKRLTFYTQICNSIFVSLSSVRTSFFPRPKFVFD